MIVRTKLFFPFIVIFLLTGFKKASALAKCNADSGQSAVTFKLLRLKLVIDSLNYDNIVIGFGSSASSKYNPQEDSQYFSGINAPEGLSSFSSDSVRLSVNLLQFPKRTPQVIKLDVEGAKSGVFSLQRTALDSIPKIYEIWLMDKYKKDSLDLKNNKDYTFYINKSDTNSFGSNRFQIVIRQSPLLAVHLLAFTATKENNSTKVGWTTENEEDYTHFKIERSIDNGATFYALDGTVSNGISTYGFLDKNPINGTDQYRLKIEDLNGKVSYSSVVTLLYGDQRNVANNISVYPNPVNGVINMSVTQSGSSSSSSLPRALTVNSISDFTAVNNNSTGYDIKILSLTGSVMKTATSASTNWQENVSNLIPGTYIIQVINKGNNALVGKSTFIKL
jgi:hypothetical protein